MRQSDTIAFFDFDGTITKKDSMMFFLIKMFGYKKYLSSLFYLFPTLLFYTLGLLSNDIAKQRFLGYFISDMSIKKFNNLCKEFSLTHLSDIISSKALDRVRWHKEKKHIVVIVSASLENWLEYWCENNSLQLIATQLESDKGKITGKFSTKNCYGFEKVTRIKKQYNLSKYSTIYAYGDSKGDKEMLNLADFSYYKVF